MIVQVSLVVSKVICSRQLPLGLQQHQTTDCLDLQDGKLLTSERRLPRARKSMCHSGYKDLLLFKQCFWIFTGRRNGGN